MLPVQPEPSVCFRAKAIRVIDGDTIVCDITRTVNVRLRDIDCPERKTEEGQEAKRFVEKTLLNKDVIVLMPTDRRGDALLDFTSFERIVGDIWIDNNNLKDLLLVEGFEKV